MIVAFGGDGALLHNTLVNSLFDDVWLFLPGGIGIRRSLINSIEISNAIGGGFQAQRHLKSGTAHAKQMHP